MDISIILVNWNTKQLLINCIDSIIENVKLTYEIWVVDNASSDGSVDAVKNRFPDINIIQNNTNLGFAAANNKALKQINAKYALLLNTDTIIKPYSIEALFDYLESSPEAAMACGQLLNADGSKQNSIANFPHPFTLLFNETVLRLLFPSKFPSKRKEYSTPISIDSCIGACLMVRKIAIEKVGLFDDRYFFFMEETDWALRMKNAGWKICFVPQAEIVHLQGQSVGHNVQSRILFYSSRYKYFKKWYKNAYPILMVIIITRLCINTAANLIASICTLFVNKKIRDKFFIYAKLLLWHFKGRWFNGEPGLRASHLDR